MSETTTGVRAILSSPRVYELWISAVGGERQRQTLQRDHFRTVPGERVLDLGCGPAELLPHLADGVYAGIDISERYIAAARERYGVRGEFRVGDATAIDEDLRDFDIVLAFGVAHHIDDAGVHQMFAGAARALKPSGRMVTVDPVFTPGQTRLARAVIERDRGRHVRTAERYAELARTAFVSVDVTVRHDLLRIPYSHCVLECRTPST
jgi:SAM-dependent methyltransferase